MGFFTGPPTSSGLTLPFSDGQSGEVLEGTFVIDDTGVTDYNFASTYLSAIHGKTTNNTAIFGQDTEFGSGVKGQSDGGLGVFGQSNSGFGVYGYSTSYVGVQGSSDSDVGGYFSSFTGTSLFARSDDATNVASTIVSQLMDGQDTSTKLIQARLDDLTNLFSVDGTGKGIFASTVQLADATANNHAVSKSQLDAKVSDTAYNAGTWDSVTTIAPSKNAVRDQIEILQTNIDAKVNDTAYDAGTWDSVTTVAPSKNAVRDQVETMLTSIAAKEPSVTATTSADYYRGDKTFQPLNTTAVGIPLVENMIQVPRDISKYAWFHEEFITNPLAAGGMWSQNVVGAGAVITVTTLNNIEHPGVIMMDTGTTATGSVGIRAANTVLFGGGAVKLTWIVRLLNLSTAAQRYFIRIGFTTSTVLAAPANGVWFEYSDNVNSGNWQMKAAKGGVVTTVNSAIAAATGWHRFEIEINAAGTVTTGYITPHGGATSSFAGPTTNIPTAAAQETQIGACIVSTVGTSVKRIYPDAVSFFQELTTAR